MADDTRNAARRSALPPSLPPLGLSREEAAEYIGIGVTLFDAMVMDGRMPKPKRVNTRKLWDRDQLTLAFKALPDDNECDDVFSRTAV